MMRPAGAVSRFVVVALITALNACSATIPLASSQDTLRKLGSDLGVPPESIQDYARCLVGRAGGEGPAPRVECVYVQTAEWSSVVDYDPSTKRFKRAFMLDRSAGGVAMQTQASLLGESRQLQVQVKESVLVVELVNADFSTIGMSDKLNAAYDHLRSLGIPAMSALAYVQRPAEPRTIYIPIYVPR